FWYVRSVSEVINSEQANGWSVLMKSTPRALSDLHAVFVSGVAQNLKGLPRLCALSMVSFTLIRSSAVNLPNPFHEDVFLKLRLIKATLLHASRLSKVSRLW